MSDDFTLCYWIRGQPLSAVSAIQISRTATVANLHTLLKEEHPIIFRDVDAADLQVYKLKDPVAEPYEENLKSVVLSECGGTLRRLRKLSDLFVSAPPEECIHVIVDAPYPEVTCWVRGGLYHESISISIKANISVNQLHARIKEAHEALKQVATERIHLYRVSGSVQELRGTLDKKDEGAHIDGRHALYDAFLDLPVLEPYFVVVQISEPPSKPPPTVDGVRVAREAFLAAHPPGTWLK